MTSWGMSLRGVQLCESPLRVLVSLTQRHMCGSTSQQRTMDNHYNFQLDYIAKYHLPFFKSSTTSTLLYESTCFPPGRPQSCARPADASCVPTTTSTTTSSTTDHDHNQVHLPTWIVGLVYSFYNLYLYFHSVSAALQLCSNNREQQYHHG
eukprot:3689180-Amphidinium_carterae.3